MNIPKLEHKAETGGRVEATFSEWGIEASVTRGPFRDPERLSAEAVNAAEFTREQKESLYDDCFDKVLRWLEFVKYDVLQLED